MKRKAEQEAEQPEEQDEKEEEHDGEEEEEEGEDDEGEEEEDDEDEDGTPSASSTGDESEDDAEGEAYKEINVEFEFFDPKEKDFHGLKALLHTYLDGQQYDCSGLVEAIIKQEEVGSVVKTSEDDDPIAVMTVFNTRVHRDKPHMRQVREFVAGRCPDAATKAKLLQALDAPGTGLVVNERLINCPPKLAPPMLQFLLEEVADAAAEDSDEEDEAGKGGADERAKAAASREEFALLRYLLFTRVYSDPLEEAEEGGDAGARAGGSGSGAGPSSSGRQQKKQKAKGPTIVYVRPEDEYLHQVCSWSYTFPVEGRPVAKDELRPLRLVMLVEAGRVAEARQMLDLVVGNMAAEAEEEEEAGPGPGPKGGPAGGRGRGGR